MVEHEHCERVIELSTRVENLEGWQKRQNGSLQRIEGKVEKMYQMVIGLLGGLVASLVLLAVNLVVVK